MRARLEDQRRSRRWPSPTLLPLLRAARRRPRLVTSDAAVEHYEGWGAYGASKAALDHLTLPGRPSTEIAWYAVDPGDMRTRMHQDAFPGEDISDRPLPRVGGARAARAARPAAAERALRASEVPVEVVS